MAEENRDWGYDKIAGALAKAISLWDGNHLDGPILRHTGRHLLKFFL
jgi:hypothetical protein